MNKKSFFKVSILMTFFNEEKFIQRSLKSLINQSFRNWEAIVIDDCSTDNSADIIKKFKDQRIKYFKLQQHKGRTSALNFGLQKCKGRFISILDADDFYFKNKLKKQIKLLKKDKEIKFLASWGKLIDSEGKKITIFKTPKNIEKIKKKLFTTNIIGHSSVIYDKNFAEKNNLIPYKYDYAVDYELTLKFLKITKVHVIPESLVAFTFRGDSVSYLNKNKIKVIKDDLKSLNYVKKNFTFDLNDKINIEFKNLKLIFKLILTKIGIV